MNFLLLAIVSALFAFLIAFLTIMYQYPKRRAYYFGKQLMSDDEFLIFKSAAVDEDIHLDVTELNSRAPIYVDFSVILPHTKTFPFGKRSEEGKMDCLCDNPFLMAMVVILSCATLCFLAMGICELFDCY